LRYVLPHTPTDFALGFSADTLWLCIGVSAILGLAAGSYPALRAASVSPIQAIRGGQ
jgi:ABC-type antimicrobial peptide transport system permease subunit